MKEMFLKAAKEILSNRRIQDLIKDLLMKAIVYGLKKAIKSLEEEDKKA